MRLHTKYSESKIIEAASKVGVGIISLKPYYLQMTMTKESIFGYSNLTEI
ncbi:MAG: hypothetical protein AAGE84_12690 [Cyanobacteria bacterium P01_G01_bin.39]